MELIANKENIPIPHCDWILMLSIVDKSLLQDNDELANSITRIAAAYLDKDPNARSDMKDAVANLSNLVKGATRIRKK